jgi:hypothetical protein
MKKKWKGKQKSGRGNSRRVLDWKHVSIAAEVAYIIRCAQAHDGKVVTLGPLLFFSTATGDAWVLDPADGDRLELQLNAVAAYARWNTIDTPIQRSVGLGVRRLPPLDTLLPLADAIKKMGSKPFFKVELSWPLHTGGQAALLRLRAGRRDRDPHRRVTRFPPDGARAYPGADRPARLCPPQPCRMLYWSA